MSKVYGIDLGTTYSAIAMLNDNGLPEIIENFADGKPILASAVYFPEGDDPVIGEAAKGQLEVEAHSVVQFVKRSIGKSDAPSWDFGGENYDPITVSSLILKRMADYAAEQGHDVKNVVITCPAYFGNEERNATRQAGTIAGLNVLNIVNEPTAAAFNYLSREFKESKKIMVYDLGGGTFDITLFDFSVEDNGKTSIEVIETGGDDKLGGADWDARLFDHIAELWADENGVDRDDVDSDLSLKQKIRVTVESTKMALTGMAKKSFTVNHDGDSTRLEVTREKFEEITTDLVDRSMNYVDTVLNKAGLSKDDIEIVLLVGGSTKMPMIKTAVENVFPGKVKIEDPDLAVAKGAAIAASVEFNERIKEYIQQEESRASGESLENGNTEYDGISDLLDEGDLPASIEEAQSLIIDTPPAFSEGSTIVDKLSRSIGPQILDGSTLIIDNMFLEGTAVPSEITKTYASVRDNQETVKITLYESLSREAKLYPQGLNFDDVQTEEQADALHQKIESDYAGFFDPSLLIKPVADIALHLPYGSPAGTPIELSLRATAGGIDIKARNPQTGEVVEASTVSENTMTGSEMNAAIARFANLQTRGDY